ncbi:MAG: phenylacetate--CoA ligase [Alphaproteobacteria bacterium]|nr:phenylacetate--CoA ligase [Alphaproteobacteria bacterium]
MRAPFYRGRLDGIDLDRLDEPDMWACIPILGKDELRAIVPDRFHAEFCIAPRSAVVEYWCSGGSTGRPLFYPRSAADMAESLLAFERAYPLIGAAPGDLVHVSFPLGVHPVSSLFARAAEHCGIATIWCGAGANTPSETQLALIAELRPSIWAGMASYGLHLANLAEAKGIDLRASSVEKIIVAAEPLSPVKHAKLERQWGAEVFDHFGMTEAAWVAGEGARHAGLHVWSDLWFVEVVDETTGVALEPGAIGSLVVTPLVNNAVTPFLRWSSGDLVSLHAPAGGDGPWSIFPTLRHARRTVGFFKVHGVNINHPDLEDLMFADAEITDFRAEVDAGAGGLDVLRLVVEGRRAVDRDALARRVADAVRRTFQVSPEIVLVEVGAIAKAFEADIKAQRFIDRRG